MRACRLPETSGSSRRLQSCLYPRLPFERQYARHPIVLLLDALGRALPRSAVDTAQTRGARQAGPSRPNAVPSIYAATRTRLL